MTYNFNILLGQITKVSGFEGAVTVKLERSFIDNIPQLESVFLEIEGRPVPFFISDSEYSGSDILKMRFNYYDSAEKVNEFKGCKIYLTSDLPAPVNDDDFGDLTGYSVYTHDNLFLGQVEEVIQNPGQWLLNIITPDKKEILFPLHEDLIVSLDDKMKIMVLKIPEGLLGIN